MQIINPSSSASATLINPVKTAGGFYSPLYAGNISGTAGSYASAANQARMYPIFIPQACTISPVCYVTGSTGGAMVVAIYSQDANGLAGNLLKSFTPLNTAATGLKTVADTLAIAPGNYWVYLNTSASPTMVAWLNSAGISGTIGVPSTFLTGPTNWGGRYEGTPVYASPAPASAATLGLTPGTVGITSPLFFSVA